MSAVMQKDAGGRIPGDVFVSHKENPMDVLGIGANMVKSLRYWLQAVGLTSEPDKGRRSQSLTELGKLIYEHDTYVEELGTLHLLQYRLSSNIELATSWYFFFNEFNQTEFDKDDFVRALTNYIYMNETQGDDDSGKKSVAIRSLSDDFVCIMGTYVPRYRTNPEKVSAENNIDCPFGELGLVDVLDSRDRTFRKTIPAVSAFNPWVILAIIIDQAKGESSISLNDLLNRPCNIGRTFNMDTICMMDVLRKVEQIGEIKIIRTAGLDVVQIVNERSFRECVEMYYKDIEDIA